VTVYVKKANGKQKWCMAEFEKISGFEFMHQEDIDSGELTFSEAWEINLQWLECVMADVENINTTGT